MGFKLGTSKVDYASGGKIKTKMRFGKESGGDASVPGTPVIRKKLEKGISAEANIDGSIYLSDKIEAGSEEERRILLHEMKHLVDMKVGKLSYTDNDITWMGETYERKNGEINYNGKWLPEGDRSFPWEQH